MRTLKRIYSNNFHIEHTAVLVILIMLYITSLELILQWKFVPLNQLAFLCSPLPLVTTNLTYFSMSCSFATQIRFFLKHTRGQDSLLLFSCSVVANSLRPHGLRHVRLPCPSLSLEACSDSCPSSRWCHPTISSSVAPFSSCPQSFPASTSLTVSLGTGYSWEGWSLQGQQSPRCQSIRVQKIGDETNSYLASSCAAAPLNTHSFPGKKELLAHTFSSLVWGYPRIGAPAQPPSSQGLPWWSSG